MPFSPFRWEEEGKRPKCSKMNATGEKGAASLGRLETILGLVDLGWLMMEFGKFFCSHLSRKDGLDGLGPFWESFVAHLL